jgi:hypothetical protein
MDENVLLLTALIQGASKGKTKNSPATSDSERIKIGSTALNRIDPESKAEWAGSDLKSVLYNPRSPFYEFNGKNERTNEVLAGKVAKYNEKEYIRSMQIASGLIKGTIPKTKGKFFIKPSEKPKMDFSKLQVVDKDDTYKFWDYK